MHTHFENKTVKISNEKDRSNQSLVRLDPFTKDWPRVRTL